MPRARMVAAVAVLILGLAPAAGEAAGPLIKISSCEEEAGTYRVTIRVNPEESSHLDTCDPVHGWIDHGTTYTPKAYILSGLPSGSTVDWWVAIDGSDYNGTVSPTGAPTCGAAAPGGDGAPLFDMWLLTGGGRFCILISEAHPSIERQQAACFPGEDWIASDAPCAGGVYADDTWVCDSLGYERAPLSTLLELRPRGLTR